MFDYNNPIEWFVHMQGLSIDRSSRNAIAETLEPWASLSINVLLHKLWPKTINLKSVALLHSNKKDGEFSWTDDNNFETIEVRSASCLLIALGWLP